MRGAWITLLLAGLVEVGLVYFLKSDATYALVAFIACAIVSFELLSRSLEHIPLSLAYAVWTGIGSVGAFVVGVVAFGEALTPLRTVLLAGVVATLVAIKLTSRPAEKTTTP